MPFSFKMQRTTFRWVLNIILAGIIFTNAEAGRLLGIQWLPLRFSAVWPATGFSLAALLLFGFRAAPGVFAGNFIYNVLHLYIEDRGIIAPFFVAIFISLGSVAQALLASYLMRRFSSISYFKTIKDVIVFLLAGGMLTCMIAPTIGVAAFYLYGVLPLKSIGFTWLTIWVGDTMGVYLLTPLLVVCSLHKVPAQFRAYRSQALAMIAVFIVLGVLFATIQYYPIVYYFIPFSLWGAYLFRFHGASIVVFLIAVVTIAATTLGYGSFSHVFYRSPMLILVMFLECLVVTAHSAAAMRSVLD